MKSLLAVGGAIAAMLGSACGGIDDPVTGLQGLANASEQVTSKVTYVPDSTFADVHAQLAGARMIVYQRPPDIRMDYYGIMDGQPFASIRIDSERGSYNCYD